MIVGDTGGTVADVALNAEVTEGREDEAGITLRAQLVESTESTVINGTVSDAADIVKDLETVFALITNAVVVSISATVNASFDVAGVGHAETVL